VQGSDTYLVQSMGTHGDRHGVVRAIPPPRGLPKSLKHALDDKLLEQAPHAAANEVFLKLEGEAAKSAFPLRLVVKQARNRKKGLVKVAEEKKVRDPSCHLRRKQWGVYVLGLQVPSVACAWQ